MQQNRDPTNWPCRPEFSRDAIDAEFFLPRETGDATPAESKQCESENLVAGARFELAIPQLRDYEISLSAMPVIR